MNNKANNFLYKSEEAYPIIGELEKNHHYAKMMLDNYGGMVSEMTAISLYIFGDICLNDKYKNVADAFSNIARVEMHHLRIMGELSNKLGQLPILRTVNYNRYIDWAASYNKYPTKMLVLLNYALHAELEAISKYERQAEIIKDKTVVACLKRIVLDEKLHVEIINKLIGEYTA